MIYLTADTHFGHRAQAERRGFASIEEMDEALVESFRRVKSNDEVLHLGDFSFAGKDRTRVLRGRLLGRWSIVPGNHDPDSLLRLLAAEGFEILAPLVRRKLYPKAHRVTLCHYPLMTWPQAHYGAWHFHGHSHGNLRAPETTRQDVGWDVFRRPVSIDELFVIMSARAYGAVDHHAAGYEPEAA